jgi:DNA-binding GntR family transcriptional regulator
MSGKSLTHHAYRQLREQICSGRFAAGKVLSESRLATELGISRTPVGEAIRQLVQEGLLEQVPRYGTVVRQIDESEMQDLFEMREALEGFAAGRAAARISASQISQLRLLGDEMEQIADDAHTRGVRSLEQEQLNRFLAIDMAFHHLVICAAGNNQIAKAVQQTRAILNIFRVRRRVHDEPLVRRAQIHHERIIAALEAADAEGAKRAMLEHLNASKCETLAYLREHEGATTPNPVLNLQLPEELKHRLAELENTSGAVEMSMWRAQADDDPISVDRQTVPLIRRAR